MMQPQASPPAVDRAATVILVVGATGGVGQRVVQRLLDCGEAVRVLVRDPVKAKDLFGDRVQIVDADLTIPETLTAAVVQSVRAVICCSGVRVQPQEGDTPDRAKYYQGIKFYLPEVVGDTPEQVDYQGMQALLQAVTPSLAAYPSTQKRLFDFAIDPSQIQAWGALDDVVMGGVSQSGIQTIDQAALFTGNVSTSNSGGFASIRTRNFEQPFDLAGYTGMQLRVKGDGQRYKFLIRCDSQWDSVAYAHSFDTIADQWIEVQIPFAGLIPVFRAKTFSTAGAINASCITSLQLMLSKFEYDGGLNPHFTPGQFALQVESIAAYGGPALSQFVLVSSAGVTRPGRPGLNLDEEPPAVRMNDQLGGILTWKLRGEDALRSSGIPYTIVRPCALTQEPGGNLLTVEQGDNLRGKISREDAATLCVEALHQPRACNLTFEVSAQPETGLVNWSELFGSLQPDRG